MEPFFLLLLFLGLLTAFKRFQSDQERELQAAEKALRAAGATVSGRLGDTVEGWLRGIPIVLTVPTSRSSRRVMYCDARLPGPRPSFEPAAAAPFEMLVSPRRGGPARPSMNANASIRANPRRAGQADFEALFSVETTSGGTADIVLDTRVREMLMELYPCSLSVSGSATQVEKASVSGGHDVLRTAVDLAVLACERIALAEGSRGAGDASQPYRFPR